ncbi:MAG: AAA family ATPase [Anaerolineae bacterium]|jgi:DNA-binding SARP family transcriptional activator/tetratricopeptide (TPR) repeat protein|nr:AAA family ATPase [Anaerolineae bacterium]MBT7190843.1 AAA family ATPase [Anaerolineae bacterium]MBT7991586.1 AAA family ATPase [Anaerolineae bacterium]
MPLLRAHLFKSLRLETENQRALDAGSPLTRSLLAYLLLHRKHPADRRRLAFLFWTRSTESAARRNLRQYLHRLKQVFEEANLGDDWVITTASTVQINPQADIWLDVDAFRHQTRPEAGSAEKEGGIGLYRGDLLDDLYEEWCESPRRELRQRYLQSLEELSLELEANYRSEDALKITRKWIAAEAYDESAHRRLMSLYVTLGKKNLAIQHYQQLAENLMSELGTEPMPETRSLVEMIQTGGMRQEKPLSSTMPKAASKVKSPQLPMVGREAELGQMQIAWKQAQNKSGGIILLSGDSGIGKTRLLNEYLHTAHPVSLLEGTCHEVEAMVAYAPLRGILQEALSRLSEDDLQPLHPYLAALTPILPDLRREYPSLPSWASDRRERIEAPEAITQLLRTLAKKTGTLLLALDDLHWADSLSWELLEILAHRLEGTPLLLIASCRLEDLNPEHEIFFRSLKRKERFMHLPLARLSLSESKQLAKYLLKEEKLDAHFFERLHEETEGNPFFIIEGIRALQEGEEPARLPFGGGLERGAENLPPPIQRLIEARLDRLDAQSQELLGIAAAIGRSFSFSLLAEVSEVATKEVINYLENWQQKGLVTEKSDGYDFTHDKIRQVAYANLSRARKSYVHRCIAEILENAILPVDAATLAHHYSRSDQTIKALPYLTKAGEQALRAHSYHEARQFGSQAVSMLGREAGPKQNQERIDLSLQLAQAYAFSGDLQRAQEMVEQAEQLALQIHDEKRLGSVYRRSAQIFWQRGNPKAANDYAHRTLRIAEEKEDIALLRAALRMLGRTSIALAAFDDAIAYLLRYVDIEDSATRYHPNLMVVYGYLGVAYARVGSWKRALDAAEHGVEIAKEQGAASKITFALAPLAYVQAARQNWAQCFKTLSAAPTPLDEEREFTPLLFIMSSLRGYTQARLDETEEGIKAIHKSLNWVEKNNYQVFRYLPRIFLAESLLLTNEISEAKKQAERALKDARESGNRWAVGVTLRILGEILSQEAKPNWLQMEEYLRESLRILRRIRARPDLARTYLALRRLYDRAGQSAWAVDCHFRATSIFDELNMAEELSLAQGHAAGERKGAVVILDMELKGPDGTG